MNGDASPMGSGWAPVFASLDGALQPVLQEIENITRAGRVVLPDANAIFAAFRCPFNEVKVILLGQDPYPTPGNANGLAFSVHKDTQKIPASLRNIFKEYHSDLGLPIPTSGDLSLWVEQGVLLLNTVLTVEAHQPNSHRTLGWQAFTHGVIRALVARDLPLVSVLWGTQAQQVIPLLGSTVYLTAPHPSPLSAHRGFLGSQPFSKINMQLVHQGSKPINWTLP